MQRMSPTRGKHDSTPRSRDEPKQHIHQIDPDSMMHDGWIRARAGGNLSIDDRGLVVEVDGSEAAEDSHPEDEQDQIPEPEDVGFDNGRDEDHDRDRRHARHRHREHPRGVRRGPMLRRRVQVRAVDPRYRDRKHELQEPQPDPDPCAGFAARSVVFGGKFRVHGEMRREVSFRSVFLRLAKSVEMHLVLLVGKWLSDEQRIAAQWTIGVECWRLFWSL